ncbi:hypothetical protein H4582DRAFT_2127566 [Lactarius indigo]|nr:hypothetical protein H4582DRAFT_2127566 [Lactarius indigo]
MCPKTIPPNSPSAIGAGTILDAGTLKSVTMGKKCQEKCHATLRDQAEWKKKTAKRLFEDFDAKTEHCLRTGEELSPRFAVITQRAMQQADVPTTLKKIFKQEKIRSGGDSVSWLAYHTKERGLRVGFGLVVNNIPNTPHITDTGPLVARHAMEVTEEDSRSILRINVLPANVTLSGNLSFAIALMEANEGFSEDDIATTAECMTADPNIATSYTSLKTSLTSRKARSKLIRSTMEKFCVRTRACDDSP